MAFGETRSVRAEHERDVGVSGLWQAEQSCEQDLARRRVREVRTPNHLAYPLRGIIDHDGELVSRSAVVAAHDEVVHLFFEAAEQPVLESYSDVLRTHPQAPAVVLRPRAARAAPLSVHGRCQDNGLRRDAVRRGCRGPDLRPRAVAGVEQSIGLQPDYGLLVKLHPLRLAHDGPSQSSPRDSRSESCASSITGTHPRAVEVLHPYQKSRPGRTREQPRQEGCSQVSEMERTRRARREASVGVRNAGLAASSCRC